MNVMVMLLFSLFIVASPAHASDVRVAVSEVNDQRSTGEFFNNLEIKLKLLGDDASSIRGIKTTISRAVDDTGRNLRLDDKRKDHFDTLWNSVGGKIEITLKLKNAARRAAVVKEITGELQLFVPDRDPAATVLIKDFMKTGGRPISNPSLAKAGVTVAILTKKEYDSLKKDEEKKAKEAARMQGLTQTMMSAFESLLGGFFAVGENDLLFKVDDPSGNLIDMDVVDHAGTKIENNGRMASQDLIVLNYNQAVPSDARLRLFLKTEKSVISVPLRLVDVALP
jgi:hypothetical protein